MAKDRDGKFTIVRKAFLSAKIELAKARGADNAGTIDDATKQIENAIGLLKELQDEDNDLTPMAASEGGPRNW